MIIKAIITTLDNLPILIEQVRILKSDPLISEIVVVNNGSIDGTKDWLSAQDDLVVINRENNGAGPGRNSGLDAAGWFDYVLMLDGGIRPLIGGTEKMLDYLVRTPACDVIGVEIPDFETDQSKAWRRWPSAIGGTYRNYRLSHTAYCLSRARAWDGLRFCEEGPFGQPGWGADDDEMAYQWRQAGIVVDVVTGIHPYRRGSGSFNRLFKETGIWPNQYGSVYEKRVVWLQHHWPQYQPGVQWGEPWLTAVVRADNPECATKLIKFVHESIRKRRFASPFDAIPNPYSVVLWTNNPKTILWANQRYLCQYHGDTQIIDGEIVHRTSKNESSWVGDFMIYQGHDWRNALRLNCHYYGVVETLDQAKRLIEVYSDLHPAQPENNPPLASYEMIPT